MGWLWDTQRDGMRLDVNENLSGKKTLIESERFNRQEVWDVGVCSDPAITWNKCVFVFILLCLCNKCVFEFDSSNRV